MWSCVPDFDAAAQAAVTRAQSGDLILLLGAGDVYRLADPIVQQLGQEGNGDG